jgi:hypothetical protein
VPLYVGIALLLAEVEEGAAQRHTDMVEQRGKIWLTCYINIQARTIVDLI